MYCITFVKGRSFKCKEGERAMRVFHSNMGRRKHSITLWDNGEPIQSTLNGIAFNTAHGMRASLTNVSANEEVWHYLWNYNKGASGYKAFKMRVWKARKCIDSWTGKAILS